MRKFFATAVLTLLVSGCGSDESEPEPSDGKIRPPPNGVRTTETAACGALSNAFAETLIAVGCVGTSPSCPSLVRTQSGADCLQYDQGSLDACIEHVRGQTTCATLTASISNCIVYAYTDSGPAGCP